MQIKQLASALITVVTLVSAEAAPMPEAFALATPEDATYTCHYDCGYAIYGSRNCSTDASDSGPWDDSCLCASDSDFMAYVPSCLDCGWCLWTDYSTFLTAALAECGLSTEPTGTACATATAA